MPARSLVRLAALILPALAHPAATAAQEPVPYQADVAAGELVARRARVLESIGA